MNGRDRRNKGKGGRDGRGRSELGVFVLI